MGKEWEPQTIFDLFGDELARAILVAASERAVAAEDLADACDASLPTVYRRINALADVDLLAEHVEVDAGGNHFKRYETTMKRVGFEIEDGGFEVDVRIRRGLSERFESFLDGLERSSRDLNRAADGTAVDATDADDGGAPHG